MVIIVILSEYLDLELKISLLFLIMRYATNGIGFLLFIISAGIYFTIVNHGTVNFTQPLEFYRRMRL